MTMTTDELKAAITKIMKDDPDFFTDLIGEVVKENLHIQEQTRDYYADRNSWVNPQLTWGPTNRESDTFSYA